MDSRVEKSAADHPDALEVVKNQRIAVHGYRVVLEPYHVIHVVPGCQTGSFILDDNDAFEADGPVVQVFLIGKKRALGTGGKPFEATVPQPLKASIARRS